MADNLKELTDYPDVSFIDNITIDELQEKMLAWYKEKYKEVTRKMSNSVLQMKED